MIAPDLADWNGIAHGLAKRFRRRFPWIPFDELLESAFMVIAEAAARYDPARGMTLRSWLFTIGLKAIAKDLAAKGLLGGREIPATDFSRLDDGGECVDLAELVADPAPDPGPELLGQIERGELLEILTLRESALISLRFREGLLLPELAEIFGMTREGVRLILEGALGKLRQHV